MNLNIYCDESTHLPHDGHPYMVLGAVTCPVDKTREISQRIAEIKRKHGLKTDFEIKWTKTSPSQIPFYLDVIDYFFDDDDLAFRAVIAQKSGLSHDLYRQTHDDWYYKMMFYLIRNVLPPDGQAFIYLDKKDTQGGRKVAQLHRVIANASYDFNRRIIKRLQIVDSRDVTQIQLADLLLGAVNYANRGLSSSQGKLTLSDRIKARSRLSLTKSTLLAEKKMNLFFWEPRENRQ